VGAGGGRLGPGRVDEAEASLLAGLRIRQAETSTDHSGVARCLEAMAWVAAWMSGLQP
jgi:hypothetical protein